MATTEARRARFGPGLWPGPCRQARRVGRGLQGQRRAAGASRASGMRSTVEAGGADPGQCAAGFRPDACGLSPGDGRTRRDADGLCLLVSRGTGPLRRVPAAAGGGAAVRGSRRARRATARRARAKLPRRYGESPDDSAARAVIPAA